MQKMHRKTLLFGRRHSNLALRISAATSCANDLRAVGSESFRGHPANYGSGLANSDIRPTNCGFSSTVTAAGEWQLLNFNEPYVDTRQLRIGLLSEYSQRGQVIWRIVGNPYLIALRQGLPVVIAVLCTQLWFASE